MALARRQWRGVGCDVDEARGGGEAEDSSVSVCQFNVLADGLAQHGNFSRCRAEHLTWEHRACLLAEEVNRVKADIYGLAECNNYASFWEPLLKQQGYASVFCAKASSPASRFGADADGCCVAVRTDRFRITQTTHRDGNPVFVACALDDLKTKQSLVVCMCHLKSGKSFHEMRSAQTRALLAALSQFEEALETKPSTTLLLGDFNAHSDEECLELCRQQGLTSVLSDQEHYAWTTWKFRHSSEGGEVEMKHTIDHILARPPPRLISFLAPPPDDEVAPDALPSRDFPSDHIPIAASLRLCTDKLPPADAAQAVARETTQKAQKQQAEGPAAKQVTGEGAKES